MTPDETEGQFAILQEQLNRRMGVQERELADAVEHLTEVIRRSEELRDVKILATWDRIAAVQRELVLTQAASDKAIVKAEMATDKRLETLNELRKVVVDQSGQFMPREVAEAQFAQVNKLIAANTEALSTLHGQEVAVRRQMDRIQPWQIWLAGALVTTVLAVVVVIVNVVTA